MEDTSRGRSWVIGGLALYVLAVAVVVLSPVSYAVIVRAIGDMIRSTFGVSFFGYGWIEFVANILMFVPLGLLLALLFRRPWQGIVLAIVLSAGAEIAQLVIPGRQASLRDILANTLGAGVGAAIAWVIIVRRHRRATRSAQRPAPTSSS